LRTCQRYGKNVFVHLTLWYINIRRIQADLNSQFDDIPVGPVGEYQRINWTNFENTVNKVPFVKPASAANFAKLPAGKRGIITFDLQSDPDRPQRFGGFLSSFRYACALPLTSIPISCSVKVAETCETIAADGFGRVTQTSITNFRYNASLTSGLVRSSSYPPYTYFCTNATFSAKSVLGTPVDLYVDEVLHGVFKSRFFDSEV
jgi:hypothetical protein